VCVSACVYVCVYCNCTWVCLEGRCARAFVCDIRPLSSHVAHHAVARTMCGMCVCIVGVPECVWRGVVPAHLCVISALCRHVLLIILLHFNSVALNLSCTSFRCTVFVTYRSSFCCTSIQLHRISVALNFSCISFSCTVFVKCRASLCYTSFELQLLSIQLHCVRHISLIILLHVNSVALTFSCTSFYCTVFVTNTVSVARHCIAHWNFLQLHVILLHCVRDVRHEHSAIE